MYRLIAALCVSLLFVYVILVRRASPTQFEANNTNPNLEVKQDRKKSDKEQDGLAWHVHTVNLMEPSLVKQHGREFSTGKAILLTCITYDGNGNKNEEAWYDPNDPTRIRAKDVFIYDDLGKKIEKLRYGDNSVLEQKEVFKYDARGQLTRREHYHPDGTLKEYNAFSYNEARQMTEEGLYAADGSFISNWVYSYDDIGTRTGVTRGQGEGYKVVLAYDSDGNITREERYDLRGKLEHKIINKYDAGGHLTERRSDGPGTQFPSKVIQIYDDKGNVIVTKFYERERLIGQYRNSYVYDLHGNWTQSTPRVEYATASKMLIKPELVNFRTITYYPD